MTGDAQTLQIHYSHRNGSAVVELSGELDLASAQTVRVALCSELDRTGLPLVVDLADLRFIDSTGLSALVHGCRYARALGRPYRVACLQPTVAKLFQITSLHEIIPVYDTVNDACSVPASQVS